MKFWVDLEIGLPLENVHMCSREDGLSMPLCVSYSGILHWLHSFNNLWKCCSLKFIVIQRFESMLSEMSYHTCGKFRSLIVPCCRRAFLTPGFTWMEPLLLLVSMNGGRWELNSWPMAGNRPNHYNNLCGPSLKLFGHFSTQMDECILIVYLSNIGS